MSSFHPYRKRPMAALSSARKRSRVAVRSFRPRTEVKHFDVYESTSIINTPTMNVLGLIAEGSDSVDRIGRRILPISLDLALVCSGGGAAGPYLMRVVVFRCKGKYTTTGTDYVASFGAMPNPDRCTVLFDEVLATGNNDQAGPTFHRKIKLGTKVLSFTSSAAADDQDGQIVAYTMTPSDYAADPVRTIKTRLWFKDQ